jgi:hypothetical protein
LNIYQILHNATSKKVERYDDGENDLICSIIIYALTIILV